MDKGQSCAESGNILIHERKRDLVASSAPFPILHGPSRSLTETPESYVVPGRDGEDSESYDSVLPSTETSDGLPDALLIKSEPEVDSQATSQGRRVGPVAFSAHVSQYVSAGSRSILDDNDNDFSLSTDEEDPEYFMDQVQGATRGTEFHHAAGSFDFISNPMSQGDGSQPKSPHGTDIASRRNRRPPMLSINSPRSYSAGLLKTGVDMGKRVDCGDSMRRVASATGPTRVCKPAGVPRTPFLNRNVGDMSQMKHAPNMTTAKPAGAPPTPDTPIVANQPGMVELHGRTETDSGASGRLSASDLIAHDPTLRTPPTTPGAVDNFFSLNSVYDMSVQDGHVAGTSYSMPMSMSVPSYIANANGCSSQPQTPSFHPQMASSGYFGVVNSNAEYQWPQESASRSHSPAGSSAQNHFMNMTSSNFSAPMGR